jgi:hypothetical protein
MRNSWDSVNFFFDGEVEEWDGGIRIKQAKVKSTK